MTISLRDAGIEAVLLDIEGTTTPIAFVHEVLFPYSRARIRDYLQAHRSDNAVQEIIRELSPEAGSPELDAVVAHLQVLIDQDRKSRPLKTLQGLIWEDGYRNGALKGDVYADVSPALARWTTAGVRVGIFSSGSVLAQQLLFGHSTAGDLTRYLTWYFDTAVGAKGDAESYRHIVDTVAVPPSQMLFVSDIVAELDAARRAGLHTLLSVRPPASLPVSSPHQAIQTFDAVRS